MAWPDSRPSVSGLVPRVLRLSLDPVASLSGMSRRVVPAIEGGGRRGDADRFKYATENGWAWPARVAWIPHPPWWHRFAPRPIKNLYLYELGRNQVCGEDNWRSHAALNMTCPQGWTRKRFVERCRQLHMVELAESAAIPIRALVSAVVRLAVLSIACLMSAWCLGGRSISASIIGGAAIGLALLPEAVLSRTTFELPALRRIGRVLWGGMVLGVAWVGVSVARGDTGQVGWRTLLSATLVGMLAGSTAASLCALYERRRRRRWLIANLDAQILTSMAAIYHHAQRHKQDWLEPITNRKLAIAIDQTAYQVEHYLAKHLGSARLNPVSVQRAADGIAAFTKDQSELLARREGRRDLVRFANRTGSLVVQRAWLELPSKESAPTTEEHRIIAVLRRGTAAVVPLALVYGLLHFGILAGAPRDYSVSLSALWLLVCVCSWLDPDFATRLESTTKLRALLKAPAGGASDHPPDRE
jgi:hypothetical protein